MFYRRLIIIIGMGISALLFNAVLITYQLPLLVTAGGLIFLTGCIVWLIGRLPRYHNNQAIWRQIAAETLRDNHAPQVLLSFFLLAFASAQLLLNQRDALTTLTVFSHQITGDATFTWLSIAVTASLGGLVYLFQERALFFYAGMVGMAFYIGLVMLEVINGHVAASGLLTILYLLYGMGSNLSTLLAYHYHRLTRQSLSGTRRDLQTAHTLIMQQQDELQTLQHTITHIRRQLNEHST